MPHAERGCGRRKPGGLYATLPLGPNGRPVEDFLQCPPKLLSFDAPTQGQLPIMRGETLHLLDWIGASYYPNVADFIEEVRRLGVSRRLSPSMVVYNSAIGCAPLEALSPGSRLLCVHPRAYIYNTDEYQTAGFPCPRNVDGHPDSGMCAGYYWCDVEGGEPLETFYPPRGGTVAAASPGLAVTRFMPSFSYIARRRPDGVTPVYAPAIFAAFPISSLVLIVGKHGEHEEMYERLAALRLPLPVRLESE